jgi:hypothetical protein
MEGRGDARAVAVSRRRVGPSADEEGRKHVA